MLVFLPSTSPDHHWYFEVSIVPDLETAVDSSKQSETNVKPAQSGVSFSSVFEPGFLHEALAILELAV